MTRSFSPTHQLQYAARFILQRIKESPHSEKFEKKLKKEAGRIAEELHSEAQLADSDEIRPSIRIVSTNLLSFRGKYIDIDK